MGYGYNESLPSQKPFMWVEQETWLDDTTATRDVGVLSFGAYNAMGLIGSEKGGVAVVHRDPHFVIATRDVPHNPVARVGLHAEVVAVLKTATMPEDCITGLESLGGFDMRWTSGELKQKTKHGG